MPAFMSSRIALDFVYASGDADHTEFYEGNASDFSTMFVPVTPSPAGMIFTAQQSNIFHVTGSFSLKPFVSSNIAALENTLILLKPIAFFRSTTGPISTANTQADSTDLYLGTEIDLVIMARILSDLGLSIGSGVLIPSAAITDSSPLIKGSVALSLSM